MTYFVFGIYTKNTNFQQLPFTYFLCNVPFNRTKVNGWFRHARSCKIKRHWASLVLGWVAPTNTHFVVLISSTWLNSLEYRNLFSFLCPKNAVIRPMSSHSKCHTLQVQIYRAHFPHNSRPFCKLDPNTFLKRTFLKTLERCFNTFCKDIHDFKMQRIWGFETFKKRFLKNVPSDVFCTLCKLKLYAS